MFKIKKRDKLLTSLILSFFALHLLSSQTINGELQKWHKVTLTFTGPSTSETAVKNPFLDYRLNVTFTHESGSPAYTIPGFYAADGDAANTSADSGDKWCVHFCPDTIGTWDFTVSFRTGPNIAVNLSLTAGSSAGYMDGDTGSLLITQSDKSEQDFRSKGRLDYVGEHYLKFRDSGEWFIKAGADAPENTLAYDDFDATPNAGKRRKSWSPHQQDYDPLDAGVFTWKNGKGTELLGSVRYLGEIKGMNSMSFLTFSLDGDDDNVYPHAQKVPNAVKWSDVYHTRFDVSKLAQWENIFAYADKKGVYLHFKTMETENNKLMDKGQLGNERKVFYRELIARFSHHLALNWNVSEEITLANNVIKQTINYIRDLDPYDHHIVFHTFPAKKQVYNEFLGNKSNLTGASLQNQPDSNHKDVLEWVTKSRNSGKKWVVTNDEQGKAGTGVDKDPKDRKRIRHKVLWGTLLAGGAGVEYYYGYKTGCSDLDCQNHRTRDQKYTDAKIALDFFNTYLPDYLTDMKSHDALTSDSSDYVFAKTNELYVIYRPNGNSTNIDMKGTTGNFDVKWYNPRLGGILLNGSITSITGGGLRSTGNPPNSVSEDWVVYIKKSSNGKNPVISFIKPQNNEHYAFPADVNVEVSASDPDGRVEYVELYLNEIQENTLFSPPYTWTLYDLNIKQHQLETRAFDNNGNLSTAMVNFSVYDPNASQFKYQPTDDAFLKKGKKGFNNSTLKIKPKTFVTYLKFKIQNLPENTIINSAELKLSCVQNPGKGTIRIFKGKNNNWTEKNLSKSNKPAKNGEISAKTSAFNTGTDYSWDLMNTIKGNGEYTFILEMSKKGNDTWFSSKETNNRPELVIETGGQ